MEVFACVKRVTTVSEHPYALWARPLYRERSVVDIDVAKPFPSIVFRSMVLVACTGRVDADPCLVAGWRFGQFEPDRLTGHGFQNLNRFI